VIAYKPAPEGEQLWYFQCKRYRSINAKAFKAEVDKYLQLIQDKPDLKPYGVVFAVSCAVSADTREDVGAYCEQHDLAYEFWALTELDMRVKQYPDLLGEFFDLQALPKQPKVYHNLPQPDYGTFIGREEELAQVNRILRPYPHSQHALVTIDGIGGIGKSALALEVAHRYLCDYGQLSEKERFDAIIWTSAKAEVLTADGIKPRQQITRTLEDIYTTIAITLEREDIARARPEEQAELVMKALTQQRTLLIVDNLETVDDERVNAFLRELPAPAKAIVTTRHRIDVAYPVRLTGISQENALVLIGRECEKKSVMLTGDEAERLYECTGGVPLAIVWSVAQMGYGYGVESVLHRLNEHSGDVARFCFQGAKMRIQGRPSHRLLLALALFTPDANRQALGVVAGLSESERDDGLVELERLSLVNKRADRFAFLPLTRSFAVEELNREPELKRVLTRSWIDYLKRLCQIADSEYYWQFKNYLFYDEGESILKAIDWAYEQGASDDVFLLTVAVEDYLNAIGDWNRIVVFCQRALELARSVRNRIAIARLDCIVGWFLKEWGEYAEAESRFSEALDQYRAEKSREGECVALQLLGVVYRRLSMFDRAKEFYDQAWDIAEELGNGELEALINDQYGKLARDAEQWELAWQYFVKARDWFDSQSELMPQDEGMARASWGQLAIVAYHLGRPQEAKELCLRSLEFFGKRETRGYTYTLRYRLALAEEALGEYDAALRHTREAAVWFDRQGMKSDLAKAQDLLKKLEQRN
jgi:tetratricopeptide (TPR) repeat protein